MKKPGNKTFKIEYLESFVEEDIPALPKTMQKRIRAAIETRLAIDPVGLGKPLRYSFLGHRRLRSGAQHIMCAKNFTKSGDNNESSFYRV